MWKKILSNRGTMVEANNPACSLLVAPSGLSGGWKLTIPTSHPAHGSSALVPSPQSHVPALVFHITLNYTAPSLERSCWSTVNII